MNYSVKVDRTQTHASFHNGTLTIPMDSASVVRRRVIKTISVTRDLELSDEARDLLDIAISIYLADKYLPRGERELWSRNIKLSISLRNPAAFRRIENNLKTCLNVLGADNFQFVITNIGRNREQVDPTPEFKRRRRPAPQYSLVALISGGQDSVSGALPLLAPNHHPFFIRINTQDGIASDDLARDIGLAVNREVNLYAQPGTILKGRGGTKFGKESSQRLRSFYFLSIATAISQTYQVNDVYINENGIMAIHLPLDPSRSSTFSTRTAYPLFLQLFRSIARDWLGHTNLEIKNQFVLKTKAEVIRDAATSGHADLVSNTISCAHSGVIKQTVKNMDKRRDLISGDPKSLHCGYCFPCILRRISMFNAGLDAQDVDYAFNPFELALHADAFQFISVQEGTSAVFSTIQFVRLIEKSTDIEFIVKYGQLAESSAVLGLQSPAPLIRLHREFAREVRNFIANKATHLLFLLEDEQSANVETAIKSIISEQALERILLEIGAHDWKDTFKTEIENAYKELRIYLQVSLANQRVTVPELEATFKQMLLNSLPRNFERDEKELNRNDGRESKNFITRNCKTRCWPATPDGT